MPTLTYFKIRNISTGQLATGSQGTTLYYRFKPAAEKWISRQADPKDWYVVNAT